MKTVTANGAAIPALGFGTFRMSGPDVLRMVPHVLKLGFRHIDTAQIYGNEAEVGDALAQSGIARADVFLTTKVWVENYRRDSFLASVDESLSKLKMDYVDLLLLHWPNTSVPLAEQIGTLNEVQRSGRVRHIGVSNFTVALMEEAISLSDAPLSTNQIEYHPYLDQKGGSRPFGRRACPSQPITAWRTAGSSPTRCCAKSVRIMASPWHRWCCVGSCSRRAS
jgi:2,5-diketo-D-gluconate reductase B